MSVKVIFAKFNQFFAKIEKFSGPLALSLVFVLTGLTFLNNQLNFDIPASSKVRDAAGFAEPFSEAKKLDLREISSAVPSTNYAGARYSYTYATYASAVTPVSSGFTIYPAATSDNSYISPYETRALAYKGHFFFGHSGNAMNWVKSAGVGSIVNANGETFRVVQKLTLPLSTVQNVYYSISEYLSYRGKTYAAIVMTCGNGTYGADGNNNNFRTFLFMERV